ncbi:class I SAM-dependent methyltransferase [Actinoplanes solisilvae]|uniref:class I SAM-dependent methyltransferase n=1 Tax=Actinoplanes solisilvae TaxID=2486853 RepID=UPI000FD9751F|nr:class I SAM-dependent methyltransferase [Actinoplanes solisilvae]
MDQDAFLGRVVTDNAAAFAGLSVSLGARLGLYRAMTGRGPMTPAQLAAEAGTVERYAAEWLAAQVAGEYVLYDAATATYELPDEHAAVLADLTGGFTMLQSLYQTEDALVEAFRTGDGHGWEQHSADLFSGVADFFRPGYDAFLVQEWLPALQGVTEKLAGGGLVADVGCGYGYSTMLMAEAFPQARFRGFDFHAPSVEAARRTARERGLSGRVSFEVASAADFPGEGYDLVTYFDCLHDLGDPGAALRRTEKVLAADGSVMIVEPNTSGDPARSINPIGRSFAAVSVVLCLPAAIAQRGPVALGNHAGEDVMRAIAADAGLGSWRVAVETVTNRIYDVKR